MLQYILAHNCTYLPNSVTSVLPAFEKSSPTFVLNKYCIIIINEAMPKYRQLNAGFPLPLPQV
jgi:hypothetical protein